MGTLLPAAVPETLNAELICGISAKKGVVVDRINWLICKGVIIPYTTIGIVFQQLGHSC
jgi:hypothetical protein